MKVSRELEAAVAKHGKVEIPETFEKELERKIQDAKKKIAAI